MSREGQKIAKIRRLAGQAERRMRIGRALRFGVDALCVLLFFGIAARLLQKAGLIHERPAPVVFVVASLCVALAAAIAFVWRLPERVGARALDRFYGLHDRLASALAFAGLAAAAQTPFMRAAIDDACRAASGLNSRRAVPIVFPRSLGVAVGLVAVLSLMTLVPSRHAQPAAHAQMIDALEMSPDDLEDAKDFLKQLAGRDANDETRAAIDAFNQLVEDIANRRVDRIEAFRRIDALEERLRPESEGEAKALEGRLQAVGRELKKAELARNAGAALAENDLSKARDALHELSKKMRSREQPVDKAKLDELREALKQAAARSDAETSSLLRRRDQLADELLKMKSAARDAGSDEEESLLRKKERELDRLDRELGDAKAAARELDRLDRELEQAAEDLMKDLGQSAQDIDDSAQDINHLQEQEMTQKEKEELKEKIEELRQLMRQQGQGGKPQMARLKRFSRMARGGKGQREGEGGDGQSGGESQESQTGGDPRSGQGQGGSEADGQGETWILGPNGEKVLMLSNAKGTGQEPGGRGGEGHEGRGAGQGHDTNVQGKATHAKMSTEDTQVQGVDTGQGGARSQVILGAAEKGFASKRYEKVYTEYHQVAEESLRKDEIPGGYRFYVKRYFQLIRPREEP